MKPFSQILPKNLYSPGVLSFHGMGYCNRREGMHWMIPPNGMRLVELSFIYNHDQVTVTVDGETQEIPADSLLLWDLSRRVDYGRTDSVWTVSWLQVWGSSIQTLLMRHEVPVAHPIQFPNEYDFQRWIELIRGEVDSHSPPSPEILLHLVEGLLLDCRRQLHSRESQPVPLQLQTVKRAIEEHFRERLTLQELAKMAGMSQAHFCRTFRKYYNVSPVDYLIRTRLHRAAELLQNSTTSVQEAAGAAGYEDVFHFSKLFKKHLGVAPLHFRSARRD